jgi:DNA polymerase III delta subunit
MNIKMMLMAYENGMSPSSIESDLGFSKWQQSINMRMCGTNNIKEINNILESLFALDYNIKSGRVNPLYGFKTALLTSNVK